jgi:hypothetical protein
MRPAETGRIVNPLGLISEALPAVRRPAVSPVHQPEVSPVRLPAASPVRQTEASPEPCRQPAASCRQPEAAWSPVRSWTGSTSDPLSRPSCSSSCKQTSRQQPPE